MRIGDWDFDLARAALRRGGTEHRLSTAQAAVLNALAVRAGESVDKDDLLDAAWPRQPIGDNSIHAAIAHLRRRLGRQAIRTHATRGYALTLPVTAAATRQSPGPGGLFGRDADLEQALDLLDSPGVLVITGPCGVGKSAFARVVLRERCRRRGGHWAEVDLITVAGGHGLVGAISQALQLQPSEESPVALGNALRGITVNVLLDNADELGPDVVALLQAITQDDDGCRWVVTQPGPLPLPSARHLPMAPLSLPQPGQDLADMRGATALQLLDARCTALDVHWRMAHQPPQALADLCCALDGLPLAIELAAPQCCAMGAEAVVQSLLRSPHDVPAGMAGERHRGIDRAAAWSIDMCPPQERQALAVLSICRGGFSLPFATALLNRVLPAEDAPTLLAQLAGRGLVTRGSGRAAWHGMLLETIRQQASALLQPPGTAADVAAAHAHVAARCARDAWAGHWDDTELRLCTEHGANLDNFRAALEWSGTHSPLQAMEIAAALAPLWRCLSVHNEGLRALARAEAGASAAGIRLPLVLLAHRQLAAALLHSESGGDEGRVAALRAAALFRRLREARGEYLALSLWLYSFRDLGPPVRRRAFARMQALEQPHWPPMLRLFGARVESPALEGASAVAAARCAQEQRLGLAREAGSIYETESALVSLADLALLAGNVHEAVRRNRDLLARLGPRSQASRMIALGNLLEGLCLLGRFAEARGTARQFAVEAPRLGYQFGMFAAYALGTLCVAQGRAQEGAMLLLWGDARYVRERRDRGPNEERVRAQLRGRLAGWIAPHDWAVLRGRAPHLAPSAMVALAVGEDLASTVLDLPFLTAAMAQQGATG